MPDENTSNAADTGTDGTVTTPPQGIPEETDVQRKITEMGQENANLRRMLLEKETSSADMEARINQLQAQFQQAQYAQQPQQAINPKELVYEDPEKALAASEQIGAQKGVTAILQHLSPVLNQWNNKVTYAENKIFQQEFYDEFPDIKAHTKHPEIGKSAKTIVMESYNEVVRDPLNSRLTQEEFNQKIAKTARIRLQRELKPIQINTVMHSGGGVASDKREVESQWTKEDAVAQLKASRNLVR